MNKRSVLAEVLFRTRLLRLFAARGRCRFLVLNYHRIWPDDRLGVTPFDAGVFGPTATEFRDQVLWMKRNFRTLLSEDDLIDAVHEKNFARGPGVMITFDDAYRDFYEIAYPVLKENRVPALVFVPSGMINERQVGWWDVIAYLVKHSSTPCFSYAGQRFDVENDRQAVIARLQGMVTASGPYTADGLINDLKGILGARMPSTPEQDAQLMTWGQIREVAASGITIGSHAYAHNVLSKLGRNEQRWEIEESRRVIEQQVGNTVRSISYPAGRKRHYNATTLDLVEQAGYELGFSFTCRINTWKSIQRYEIRRCEAESSMAVNYGMCFLPEVFCHGLPI